MNDWPGLLLRCDPAADGITNMRLDSEMLTRAEAGRAEIRIYSWDGPWVSLGTNQALLETHLPQVIRPTGGRAVLHGDDITVSIALPLETIGASSLQLRSIYRYMIEPLMDALRSCGLPVVSGEPQSGGNRVDCFASIGSFDLAVVGPNGDRQKVGGAALKTSRSAALLQVSILVLDSPAQGPFAARKVPPWNFEALSNALDRNWHRRETSD